MLAILPRTTLGLGRGWSTIAKRLCRCPESLTKLKMYFLIYLPHILYIMIYFVSSGLPQDAGVFGGPGTNRGGEGGGDLGRLGPTIAQQSGGRLWRGDGIAGLPSSSLSALSSSTSSSQPQSSSSSPSCRPAVSEATCVLTRPLAERWSRRLAS